MAGLWMTAALLLASGVAVAQAQGVLRVTVRLADAAQAAAPIAGHALLISDAPPSRTPRRVVTAADGTVSIPLRPGSYIVESDRAVAFQGNGYRWFAMVDVAAAGETSLALTGDNAERVPLSETAPPAAARGAPDPSTDLGKWQGSIVTIWSPRTRASGFLIDRAGLIATDGRAVHGARTVEVQLSPTTKVPGRVLVAAATHDAAIVWIDPRAFATVSPVPLDCPARTSVDTGAEVVTLTASPRGTGEIEHGEITGAHPRGLETDVRLSFGEAGGPVFAGSPVALVGLTSRRTDEDANRDEARVVRAGVLCEALSAARSAMAGDAPPAPMRLPVEPAVTALDGGADAAASASTVPPVVSSDDFDVAFITPQAVREAQERAGWTGGRTGRSPQAQARLGRLTDFGAWSEYFAAAPPVLIVRVTPKLVEGFWMRLAREAARTQGAALPAFKDFKTNFLQLRATCGDGEVLPIHPFVLEHVVDPDRVIREGLYVFAPEAFGPHCKGVTLTLASERAPEAPDRLDLETALIEQLWRDLAPARAAGQ